MYEFITNETLSEYEAFVQSHPKGNFAQSRLWGLQKPMWKWDAVAVRGADGKIKGTLALMTRKVPGIGRSLMYGCRGLRPGRPRDVFRAARRRKGACKAVPGLRHQNRP